MKSLLLAATAVAVLAQPALAASQISGIVADIFAGNWPQSTAVDDKLFNPINIDTATYGIGEARLDSVAEAFGGKIQHAFADNGAPLSWLCYDHGGMRTWFVSTGKIDQGGGILIGLVAEEPLVSTAPAAGCLASNDTLVPLPGNDIPGVGAGLADLVKRFGQAAPDANGKLSYFSQVVDADGRPAVRNIYYTLQGGLVVAVAFTEVNVDA